jgi:Transglycosylase SLT domain
MQFLPGTWSRYAADGDGDGKAEVQNLFDSTLAAARYLCSGGLNLRDQSQVMAAILRYNNSVAYARNVLGWAAAYATGVVPVDLPPITGPVPALADPHLENYEGLGPGLPLNALGLPATDPLALMPLMGRGDVASQIPVSPGQALGPLPGPGPAFVPQQVPEPEPLPFTPGWVPPWAPKPEPQRPPECAVFCIESTPPPAAPPLMSAGAPVPEAHPLLPPAPPPFAPPPFAPPPFAPPPPGPPPAEPAPVMPPALGPPPGPAA